MSRPTRTERRRAQLALKFASLEKMEAKSLITESLGILTAGIGVPAAVMVGRAEAGELSPVLTTKPRSSSLDTTTVPMVVIPAARASGGGGGSTPSTIGSSTIATAPTSESPDFQVLMPKANTITVASAAPANSGKGGGAGGSSHGGSGSTSQPATTGVAASAAPSSGSSASGASTNSAPILPASTSPSSSGSSSSAVVVPVTSGTNAALPVTSVSSTTGTSSPSLPPRLSSGGGGSGGGFAMDMPSFTNFPIYTLDQNAGEVILPGADQLATPGGDVDLRAQVADTTVSSYSWNTSGLSDATDIAGSSTYDLTFEWDTDIPTATTNSVTLTVTNSSSQTEIQTYTFQVPASSGSGSGGSGGLGGGTVEPGGGGTGGGSGAGSGTGTATWPTSLSPDTESSQAPPIAEHNVSVDANSGSLDTAITLPTYNPNVPAVVLSYDEQTADPTPLIVGHHTIDPTQAVPSQVSAQLTFDGTSVSTYYYNTSELSGGDVQQIALQADASSLTTGRYAYTITTGDIRSGSTTTTTASGTTTVINDSGSALGSGWSVSGLESIIPASGGVILNLGSGGKSLWFATGSGSTYTDPAGEFSILVADTGGGYTRTLTTGETLQFNSSGQEIADVDTNGVAISYTYDGSGRLSTIEDHYGNITTFSYSGSTGLLSTIEDPAGRIATFTHSGTTLSGVELPDTSTWSYGYNGSTELTQVTDPNSDTVTVAYDSANRVGTITNPDATSETFVAAEEQGFVPSGSGTSSGPATATLLATATSNYIDPVGNEANLYPDWQGLGLTNVASDPLGDISTADRDGNGLATISIDRLNRTTQYVYDADGNVSEMIDPALNTSLYTYNSFSELTSYTDPNGNTTTYTYDSHGNNTIIEDALGNLTTMTYTATGQLATSENANHNVTTYAYDSQDRLTTVTNPDGSTKLYGYNAEGDETSTTDGRGFVTTMSYDAMNRETGTTDALGDKATYVYDAAGNEIADQEPLSRTTSYSYDSMDRIVTETDPLGNVTTYGYDADGDQTTVTDPMDRITTTIYDALNRPVAVTDPMGGTTTTVYDADGETLETIDPLGRTTSYTYTVLGEVTTVTDPMGNITTYNYDVDGNLSGELQEMIIGDEPTSYTYDADERVIAVSDHLSRTTTTVYDAVGNKIATVDGAGDRTTYTYNSMNEVIAETDPMGNVTSYAYDADGDQTTVEDPLGDVTTTVYDSLDRVSAVEQAIGGETTYAYDAAGRQVGLTDPDGNRTTWTYDANDWVTAETTPLGSTTYAYDADGEETATTDADGRQTTYSYNANGEQTGETWVGSSPAEVITYTYDADDEMTGADDAFATLTFSYDADGEQLTAATSSPGGQPEVTLSSTYNADGDRTSLSDNLSSPGVISYSYDSMDEMTSISATFGTASTLLVTFGYDRAGRMTSIDRSASTGSGGSGGPGGIIIGGGGEGSSTAIDTNLSYDADGRVTTIIHDVVGGSVLETFTYDYNAASELTAETNHEGTLSYTYDADGELTGVSGASTATYTYDSNGNRTMTGYSTGTDNELTAGAGYTYTYNADDNLISETQESTGDVTTYTWDYRNRLTGVVEENSSHTVIMQATYTYDALNRRIGTDEKVSGTEIKTWTVYDGANSYAEFDGSGDLLERYLYGPNTNQILARVSGSGTEAWYLADNEGTIRDIVNTSGTVIDHIAYDAYGNVISESDASNGDQFKFDGMAWDGALELYYDNARYYDPATGEFISQDPTGFNAGDANLERFVANSPTNFIDPTGENALGDYWYYLTHPSAMDGDLQTGQRIAVGTAIVAGSIATGGVVGNVVAGAVTTASGSCVIGAAAGGAVGGGVTSVVGQVLTTGTVDPMQLGTEIAIGAVTGGLGGLIGKLLGGGCFAGETPLLIPGGSKSIRDFRPGDIVLALPEDNHDAVPIPREVEAVIENYLPVMGLRIGRVLIRTTIEHPIWVEGRGWTPANLIIEGDRLRSHDGTVVVVTGVEYSLGLEKVYNLSVGEYHTFFVGAEAWGFSIWVHNACVYQSFNPKTGKGYVGVAGTRGGTNPVNQRLVTAAQKTGSPAGVIAGTENLSDNAAYAVEQALIATYNTISKGGRLYNIAAGFRLSPAKLKLGYKILKAIGYKTM